MTNPESTPDTPDESELKSDEEWKQRVKAEDAALEESMKADASNEPAESEQSADDEPAPDAAAPAENSTREAADAFPMPPPTFEVLVGMFSTQAMVSLGVIPNPATGKAETTPGLAKHFIDLLGVLEEKTVGNLEPREKMLLDESLHQLRMAYVQATK